MSTFYLSTNGQSRGVVKSGSKKNGLSAHLRTYDFGIEVEAVWDEEEKRALFHVWTTGGSSDSIKKEFVGVFYKRGE